MKSTKAILIAQATEEFLRVRAILFTDYNLLQLATALAAGERISFDFERTLDNICHIEVFPPRKDRTVAEVFGPAHTKNFELTDELNRQIKRRVAKAARELNNRMAGRR